MRNKMILVAGLAALVLSAQDKPMHTKMAGSAMDSHFAMKAAEGGMAEVEMGKLAAQKGSDDSVKQFGQRMVDDHSKAGDELKSLAGTKNMTLPTGLNAKDKAMVNKLSAMSGTAFDKAYMMHMVQDHKMDVADFQKEANGGHDADVKAWAAKTLPTLQDHLKMAQDANAKVAGK